MAQKLPKLEMMKPIEDIMNNIHPMRFIVLFFIFFLP